MTDTVDFSSNAVGSKQPCSACGSGDAGSQGFADCYQRAVHAELAEQQPVRAEDKTGNKDGQSAKKMSDKEKETAAALLLLLFSQQMPSNLQPPDIHAEETEDSADAKADTSSPTTEKKTSLPLDTAAFADTLSEADNLNEAPVKPATHRPEKALGHADKDPAAPTLKTPPTAQTSEERQASNPPGTDLGNHSSAPLNENHLAPRPSLQSNHLAPTAPQSSAQAKALSLHGGQFGELLSQRVLWLSSQNLQSAQIELNPKELGTLEVRIALAAGQTEVHFASSHTEVRALLEGQLYRLQAMLENQGLPAPRLGIFDMSNGQNKESSGRQSHSSARQKNEQIQEGTGLPPTSKQTLIDYYA